MLLKFLKCVRGTTAVEYVVIGSVISIAIVAGATAIGSSSTVTLQNIAQHL